MMTRGARKGGGTSKGTPVGVCVGVSMVRWGARARWQACTGAGVHGGTGTGAAVHGGTATGARLTAQRMMIDQTPSAGHAHGISHSSPAYTAKASDPISLN